MKSVRYPQIRMFEIVSDFILVDVKIILQLKVIAQFV